MTLGSHQRTIGASQVHITPRWVLDPLGPFDLDPCGNDPRPWDCAAVTLTEADDGLTADWGRLTRIWLNPPFHRYQVGRWIGRIADHGRGVALLHARTETDWFKRVWAGATALLFLGRRIIFHKPDGSLQTTAKGKVANSGAPPVLCAFGFDDAGVLAECGLDGAFVPLRFPRSVVIVALDESWREAIARVIRDADGPVTLADLYRAIGGHAKARGKRHWREKVRQTLNRGGFERVGRGLYAEATA
ncbi:MAG: adenine methyltransferase [Bauldia sp.]|nr:adenine methyltransferase [Bauldia sp.]